MGLLQSNLLSNEYIINNNKAIKNLNNNITKIKFDSRCDAHPKILLDDNITVETIDLTKSSFYSESLEHLPPILNDRIWKKINNFPQSLESLRCSDEFYFRQINIPTTLKKLILSGSGINPGDN